MENIDIKNRKIRQIVYWDLTNTIDNIPHKIYFDLYANIENKVTNSLFPIKNAVKVDMYGR